MKDYSTISSKELINLKEELSLAPVKFEKEIEAIEQELIIRTIPECRPLSDILGELS